jgi:hypothetical protein
MDREFTLCLGRAGPLADAYDAQREGMGVHLGAPPFLTARSCNCDRRCRRTRQIGSYNVGTVWFGLARSTLGSGGAGARIPSKARHRGPPPRHRRTAEALDRAVAQKRILWYTDVMTSETGGRRVITSRVFRAGETPPDDDWSGISVAERIDAVWELTRQCLEWTRTGTDEPRLQRSVSRVQRARR